MASTRPIELKLSASEQKLLAMIPANGQRLSTEALVAAFYKGHKHPFNARQIIVGRMRSIMRKQEYNSGNTTTSGPIVHKSERRGPKSIDYWVL